MKGKKTGGRVKKNSSGRRIHFVPDQQVLDIYDSWDSKSDKLNQAILRFHQQSVPQS